jgi:Zn finger protein HypA/HybF involved in hydrogenase expression
VTKKRHNISDDELAEAVASSPSLSHALRKLGLSPNGGTHGHYTKRVKEAGISTEHFLPNRNTYGIRRDKLKPSEILVRRESGSNRTHRSYLLRALLELGVEYKCVSCNSASVWNGKPLTLEIDHIDGNRNNNQKNNLRFLCPNCHSQTETFSNKKLRRKCKQCETDIRQNSKNGFCRKCAHPKKTKIKWPDDAVLFAMLAESNYTQVGKKLGVSDNAVRKHVEKIKHP